MRPILDVQHRPRPGDGGAQLGDGRLKGRHFPPKFLRLLPGLLVHRFHLSLTHWLFNVPTTRTLVPTCDDYTGVVWDPLIQTFHRSKRLYHRRPKIRTPNRPYFVSLTVVSAALVLTVGCGHSTPAQSTATSTSTAVPQTTTTTSPIRMLDALSDDLGNILTAARTHQPASESDCLNAQTAKNELDDQLGSFTGIPRDLARKAVQSLNAAVGSCGSTISPLTVALAKDDVDALRKALS